MSRFLPPAASASAPEIDRVLGLVHGLMLVLFVGWAIYFVWVLVRFRSGRQAEPLPNGATGRLATWTEIAVVAAEGVLLVVFALPVWFRSTSAAPLDSSAIVVHVVAEQFAWNVHYAGADGRFGATSASLISPTNPLGLDRGTPSGKDDVVMLAQLHVPVGRLVVIQLTSKDVIHSFGVPAMRVKRDVIPGMFGSVWFTPTRLGTFDIACSQLCGMGHYRMRGELIVESQADFDKFLASEAAGLGGGR